MTLPLGDGVVMATRWRDGAVSLALDADRIYVSGDALADKLEHLARFVRGCVREAS